MEHIIAGLGNPGQKYADTRHNAGRMVLEVLKKRHEFPQWEDRDEFKALISRGIIDDDHVTLLEPNNYMNNSGIGVGRYVKDHEDSALIVVHDDIDLPVGSFRISYNRGAGGHNGVLSIEKHIGTKKFVRLRIGIAPLTLLGTMRKPRGEKAVQQFVLKNFNMLDRKRLNPALETAADAIQSIIVNGRTKAMNKYNAMSGESL